MKHLQLSLALALIGIALFAAQTKPAGTKTDPAAKPPATADRLNNLGVGYMNQQQFEKALKYFQQAHAADPQLLCAQLNHGIALFNLQRLEPARTALEAVVRRDPKNARAWYNLGLLYRAENQSQAALDAFQHVTQLEPSDADTFYFLGSINAQLKQFPQAISSFQQALKLNPYHASAEFGLARAYQQSGQMDQARQHLARFQQITKTKLGAPMSVAYGEQGPLSLAASASATPEEVLPAIPVRFVAVTEQAGLETAALKSATAKVEAKPKTFADFAGPGAC